ncbi:MAG: 7-carboxy-7-deazaguanine synthase QueE [Planctomycetota bacterium]
MDCSHLFLDEIFLSLQGEGLEVGRPHLFLRLGGCPLRCAYCDTPRSWKQRESFDLHSAHVSEVRANPLSADDLSAVLQEVLTSYGLEASDVMLAVTGGEPLVQAQFLASWLPQWDGSVLLETAGVLAQSLQTLIGSVQLLSLDWKLAETLRSGEELLETEACLVLARQANCTTQIKLVLTETTSAEQVSAALEIMAAKLPGATVFLQPVTPFAQGPLPPTADCLLDWCLQSRALPLDLRVLPQVHPLLGVR